MNIFKENGLRPEVLSPDNISEEVFKAVEKMTGHFFKEFIMAEKKNLKRLDFVVLPISTGVREKIKKYFESCFFITKTDGKTDSVLFPYKGRHYQINLIYCTDCDIITNKFFYCQPDILNIIIRQFAKSVGMKINSKFEFMIKIIDRSEKDHYFAITDNVEKGMKLLGFENPIPDKSVYDTPENFAKWTMSSPRFDSKRFRKSENSNIKKNEFCSEVLKTLYSSETKSDIIPTQLNLQFVKENTVSEHLKSEIIDILQDDDLIRKISEEIKRIERKITGDDLIEMGYEPGPIFREIIKKTKEHYKNYFCLPEKQYVKTWIKSAFPLSENKIVENSDAYDFVGSII